ncbi:MAG: NAD-dependent dehydratase [Rhodospirillaceae bacterium]|nr:NAD-dependent dehydratase [Rhodospirillaceae bacterium]
MTLAVVAGATGMVGTRIVERLAEEGWPVVGLCRNPPAEAPHGVDYLAVDLMDGAASRKALSSLTRATHLFYAGRAPHSEGGESVEANMAMLRHFVEPIEAVAPLAHVHLVHGTKYYGCHLGAFRTPAKEDDARHMPPNFYFDQQDWIVERAARGGWHWTISRPNIVFDFAPKQGRNLITLIATYALISKELGLPLSFPGLPTTYRVVTECTDAVHLAKAIVWMAGEPACADQVFNVTNGDYYRWENLWPRIADHFGTPEGPIRPLPLAEFMADKAPVWDRIVARNGLVPTPYAHMALWPYGDFIFRPTWDMMSDTTKLRRFGFADVVDSEDIYLRHFESYRAARIIP